MSLGKVVLLCGLAGCGYFAYKRGYLDGILQKIGLNDVGQSGVVESTAGQTQADPIQTTEMQYLTQHSASVFPWARANIEWVSAMMWRESRGDPNAISGAGARGLMQVMPDTMADLHSWGYDKYPAMPNQLHLPEVGIYFGTAYLEYLAGKSTDRDWITRAYNAGPGGEREDGTWPAETVNYLKEIKGRFAQITQA